MTLTVYCETYGDVIGFAMLSMPNVNKPDIYLMLKVCMKSLMRNRSGEGELM